VEHVRPAIFTVFTILAGTQLPKECSDSQSDQQATLYLFALLIFGLLVPVIAWRESRLGF